jgi:hypothetical protein
VPTEQADDSRLEWRRPESGRCYPAEVSHRAQPTRLSRRARLPAGRRDRLLLGGALLALLVLVIGAVALLVRPADNGDQLLDLVPAAELDRRWGSYLSEREWGTPREAVGPNGWGLSWRGAIDTDYRYSDDGIAGITDTDNQFRLSWAFWDGAAEHVSERFYGATNPQGASGETIVDDRVFLDNTPTHAYQRLLYRYPRDDSRFLIQLETARYDDDALTMVATVTNTSDTAAPIEVVFKGWTSPDGKVSPLSDGLLLESGDAIVAVAGPPVASWQISADKGAIDRNLRAGGLNGESDGHIGALAYRFDIAGGATSVVRVAAAEAEAGEGAADDAAEAARHVLRQSGAVLRTRREESRDLFGHEVTAHEELYRQALMSLLWNESYYRWDGASGVNPRWAGLVDVHDVLIMPDKWEYPWLASWDSAFHAVTAALIDPQIARDQLRLILSERWQQPDGHIPCGEWVMDEECPPVFAWAVWRVYEAERDVDFLTEVYPHLQANYDYWWRMLQVDDALFTGGFLGMDNLPRGRDQAQADATAWMAFFARDMARIASELRDQAASERYWIDRGRIQEQINEHLWDEETGFYYDRAGPASLLRHKSYSGLIPLIAGVVPDERLPRMLEALRDEDEFMSVGGIRSLSAESPLYVPGEAGRSVNSNWRGPVWLPINYLLVQELADIDPHLSADLRRRLVETVERDWRATGRFHEFFDGDTGAGLGADAQAGWTALVANLIREGWPASP